MNLNPRAPRFVASSIALPAWNDAIIFAVFLVFVLAYCTLPWVLAYVPSQDGPSHINIAAILSDVIFRKPTTNLQFYTIRPNFYTNFGVDIIALPLMPLFGPIITEKIILSLVLVLLPVAGFVIIRSFARHPLPAVLLLIPYAYTTTTVAGNYNFLLAVIAGLFIFAAVARQDFPYSPKQYLGLSLAWLFAVLIHPAGTVIFFYFSGVFILAREILRSPRFDVKRAAKNLIGGYFVTTLPALAVLSTFFLLSPPSDAEYQRSLYLRMREFVIQWELYRLDRIEIYFALVLSATLLYIGFAIARVRWTENRTVAPVDAMLVVSVAAVFLYMIAPNKVSGGDAFVSRIQIFPFLFFIMWSACQWVPKSTQAAIFAFALLVNGGFLWTAYAVDRRASEDMREYFRLAQKIEQNSIVLPIIGETRAEVAGIALSEMKIYPFQHLHNDIAVLRHSVFLDNWNAHFRVANVMFRAENDPYRFASGNPMSPLAMANFERATGKRVDYLLLWRLKPGTALYTQALELATKDFDAVEVTGHREVTGLYRRHP